MDVPINAVEAKGPQHKGFEELLSAYVRPEH